MELAKEYNDNDGIKNCVRMPSEASDDLKA